MFSGRKNLAFFVISLCALLLGGCTHKPAWIVYYGDTLTKEQIATVDYAIVEPQNTNPSQFPKSRTRWIGYISVGEAEEYRPYWNTIKDESFILDKNPNWPQSHYVDLRSEKWQALLINQIIPDILKKGYDGLFLDTLDTAAYLEEVNPEKYQGSRAAMVGLVKTLRKKFPNILIFPNNALDQLDEMGPYIDGVVVEDLYTRYDFSTQKSVQTPLADTELKEKFLDEFKKKFKKPVFNILYETNPHSELAQYGMKKSAEKKYDWYLTTVDLMTVGTAQK